MDLWIPFELMISMSPFLCSKLFSLLSTLVYHNGKFTHSLLLQTETLDTTANMAEARAIILLDVKRCVCVSMCVHAHTHMPYSGTQDSIPKTDMYLLTASHSRHSTKWKHIGWSTGRWLVSESYQPSVNTWKKAKCTCTLHRLRKICSVCFSYASNKRIPENESSRSGVIVSYLIHVIKLVKI